MAKRRRGYFKHFNDAYSGASISEAMADREYFCVHLFWAIVGRANQKGSGEFTEKLSYFTRLLRITRPKLERELSKVCSYFDDLVVTICGKDASIFLANYAEYQDLRSTNNPRKCHDPNPIKDKRLKIKDPDGKSALADGASRIELEELRFSASEDLKWLANELRTLFDGKPLPMQVKSRVGEIYLSADKSRDTITKVLDDLFQNPKVSGEEEVEGVRDAYVTSAILASFGLQRRSS